MTDRDANPPAAAAAPAPREGAAVSSTDRDVALWTETFQQMANAVAHDLRNSFNAVAVNLEVVRSRASRGAEPAAVAPFAATAANHFELAAAAAEALLGFARPEPERVDVAAVVGRLARLLAVTGPERLRVTDRSVGTAITGAPPDIVRSAVARSVLAALDSAGPKGLVSCEIAADDGIFLRVICSSHMPPMPDSRVVAAATTNGIRFVSRDQTLELRFP